MTVRACVVILVGLAVAGSCLAQAPGSHETGQRAIAYNLPSQPLADALKAIGAQGNINVLMSSDLVDGRTAPALKASLTFDQAITEVLKGSGLTYKYLSDKTIMLSLAQGKQSSAATDPPTAAVAQGTEPDSQEVGQLEEVVVTARFRTESVQHVGAAISPITADIIEQEGIKDFEDIARRTPGLASTDRGPNTHEVLLRGIANQTTERVTDISAVGPLVSQFLDDVPFSSASASQRDVNLFDFSRVEVLRGPQPTFFGEGSVGGSIRYLSADPNLTVGAFGDPAVRVGLSSTRSGGLNGYGNAAATFNPVAGVFGVRAVFNWRDDDGFIDSPLRHTNNTNTFRSLGGHIVALFKPDERLSIRFAAHLSRDRTGDLSYVDVNSNPADLVLNTPVAASSFDNVGLYSLKADYILGPITVTSITGYYRRDRETTGYDPANSGYFGGRFNTAVNILIDNPLNDRSWTQELRFVSNFRGPLNFTGGLFYKNKDSTVVEGLTSPDGTFAPFQAIPGAPIFNASTSYQTRQYSGFLEGTYSVTDRFRLIGGARYVHERVASIVNDYLSVAGVDPPIATVDFATFLPQSGLPTSFSFDLSKVLPRGALEYDLSKDALLYASVATGVRNGNLNTAVSAFQAAGGGTASFGQDTFARLLTFHDDKVLSYESGLKTRSLNNRLTVNAAAYFTRYEDPQIYTATPFVLISNGPAAHIKGFEIETNFRANEFVSVFANASYTDARFIHSALLLPTLAPAITADVVAGNQLANVPRVAYSLGLNSKHPVGELSLVGYLGFDYMGSRNAAAENFVSTELPAIGILNARFGVQKANWSIVGYVTNATNKLAAQSINATGGAAFINSAGRLDAPVNSVSVNRPRTIGVELTLRP